MQKKQKYHTTKRKKCSKQKMRDDYVYVYTRIQKDSSSFLRTSTAKGLRVSDAMALAGAGATSGDSSSFAVVLWFMASSRCMEARVKQVTARELDIAHTAGLPWPSSKHSKWSSQLREPSSSTGAQLPHWPPQQTFGL